MSDRIWAVEVHILVAEEATMLVLCMDLLLRDAVPCITHPLLNVAFRERVACQDALPPEVEEGVVEGRETFS